MKSTNIQRLGKLSESIVIDSQSNTLPIKTAEFEHPEMGGNSTKVPERFEHDIIRSLHKYPQ